MPAVVRVVWLRAELLHLPGRLIAEPRGEPLYQAVAGLRGANVPNPGRLVDEFARRDDPVLRAAALRLCREALHAAVLAPAPARHVLVRLLDSTDPDGCRRALDELAQPWAAVDPVAPHRLHALLAGGGPEPDRRCQSVAGDPRTAAGARTVAGGDPSMAAGARTVAGDPRTTAGLRAVAGGVPGTAVGVRRVAGGDPSTAGGEPRTAGGDPGRLAVSGA